MGNLWHTVIDFNYFVQIYFKLKYTEEVIKLKYIQTKVFSLPGPVAGPAVRVRCIIPSWDWFSLSMLFICH